MLLKLSPVVNFINIVSAAFFSYMYVEKAAKMMFVQKICRQDVGEIDTKSQY